MSILVGECIEDGCKNSIFHSSGRCKKHYTRWYRKTFPRTIKCSVVGCNKVEAFTGLCGAHYSRKQRHGSPLLGGRPQRTGMALRFYKETVLNYRGDDCLIWPYLLSSSGYGALSYLGNRHSVVSRLICEHFNGPPPSRRHQAAHSCGVRSCCNGRHVSWKTPKENNRDKILHGTAQIGEKNGNSKLSVGEVVEIRKLVGKMTHKEIAKLFSISSAVVSAIAIRRSWRCVL